MICIWHSGNHACISCSQIIMEILSDAEWLEEDLPALHNLTLRILVLELLASGFNDTFCASLKSQQRGDVVRLHWERREKKITKDKIVAEGIWKGESRRIYRFWGSLV